MIIGYKNIRLVMEQYMQVFCMLSSNKLIKLMPLGIHNIYNTQNLTTGFDEPVKIQMRVT